MSASDSFVKSNTPRDQYTASKGDTEFPYNFIIFDEDDLTVLETSDPGGPSESTSTLSRGTDYTVSGVGDENGGKITLTSGATDGNIFTIVRDTIIKRITDFLQTGNFSSANINSSLDTITTILQEHDVGIKRALQLPESSQLTSIELPKAESDYHLKWNGSGNGIVNKQPKKIVGDFIKGGDNVSINYDAADDEFVFSSPVTAPSPSRSDEEIQDVTAAMIVASGVLTKNYDDPADTLTLGVAESDIALANLKNNGHSNLSSISSDDHHSKFQTTDLDIGGLTNVNAKSNDKIIIEDNSDNNNKKHVTAQSVADLGVSDHANLTNVNSGQHHSKTSNASELTDVSADSVSDAHHTKFSTGDIDISGQTNISPADDDKVLVSDTSDSNSIKEAKVSDIGGGGGGIWTKDGELNSNVKNQVTYSMSQNWDKIKVFGRVFVDDSTGNNPGFDISMRVNNDSGGTYEALYISPGSNSKDSCFRLISGDDSENVQGPVHYIMDGRWNQESLGNEYWTMNNLQPHSTHRGSDNERLWVNYRGSVNNGSPLTQFTFLENRNDHDIKVKIKVFGMDLP